MIGSEWVIDATLDNFMKEVIEDSRTRLVLVDFWATWCGPCKQLTPLLEKLVMAHKGAVKLAKVDIEKCPEIAQQMRIQSVPAVFAFFKGQPVDGFMGALPEPQIKSWIDRLVKATGSAASTPEGDLVQNIITEADALLAAKDYAGAEVLYADAMDRAPDNAQAYAGLLRASLGQGHLDAARKMLDMTPPEIIKDKAILSARAEIELAEQAKGTTGELDTLLARVAKSPNDHEARFELAMAHFGCGAREEAVEDLLEIIRRDRQWNEEAARKQLLKFFEAFGLMDPLSVESRKKLSAILFS